MVSTGTVEWRTTFSATLPIRRCDSPLRPDVLITTRSARRAASRMHCEASPDVDPVGDRRRVGAERLRHDLLELRLLLRDELRRRRQGVGGQAEGHVGGQVERHDHVQRGDRAAVCAGQVGGGLEGHRGLRREVVGHENPAEERGGHGSTSCATGAVVSTGRPADRSNRGAPRPAGPASPRRRRAARRCWPRGRRSSTSAISSIANDRADARQPPERRVEAQLEQAAAGEEHGQRAHGRVRDLDQIAALLLEGHVRVDEQEEAAGRRERGEHVRQARVRSPSRRARHSTRPSVTASTPASRCCMSSALTSVVCQKPRGPKGHTPSTAIERRNTKTPSATRPSGQWRAQRQPRRPRAPGGSSQAGTAPPRCG